MIFEHTTNAQVTERLDLPLTALSNKHTWDRCSTNTETGILLEPNSYLPVNVFKCKYLYIVRWDRRGGSTDVWQGYSLPSPSMLCRPCVQVCCHAVKVKCHQGYKSGAIEHSVTSTPLLFFNQNYRRFVVKCHLGKTKSTLFSSQPLVELLYCSFFPFEAGGLMQPHEEKRLHLRVHTNGLSFHHFVCSTSPLKCKDVLADFLCSAWLGAVAKLLLIIGFVATPCCWSILLLYVWGNSSTIKPEH